MTKSKLLKILYRKLYDDIKNRPNIISLCVRIDDLFDRCIINHPERDILMSDFNSSRPTKKKYSRFYVSSQRHSSYWWENSKEGTQDRKDFILMKLREFDMNWLQKFINKWL